MYSQFSGRNLFMFLLVVGLKSFLPATVPPEVIRYALRRGYVALGEVVIAVHQEDFASDAITTSSTAIQGHTRQVPDGRPLRKLPLSSSLVLERWGTKYGRNVFC